MSEGPFFRPSRSLWLIRLAYVTAQRASCTRKKVGALIVDKEHRIVASGYNGAPAGMPDCLHNGCDLRMIDGRESCVRTLHAESNAIDYAGRNARGCTLFTTVVPCRLCALRIVQAGISRVVFHEFYVSQGTRETFEILDGGRVPMHQYRAPQEWVEGVYAIATPQDWTVSFAGNEHSTIGLHEIDRKSFAELLSASSSA